MLATATQSGSASARSPPLRFRDRTVSNPLDGNLAHGMQSSVTPRIRTPRDMLLTVSTVLATVPDDVARKVADDVRTYGRGYIRIDAEGRAQHVPSYLVLDPAPEPQRGERRMHE